MQQIGFAQGQLFGALPPICALLRMACIKWGGERARQLYTDEAKMRAARVIGFSILPPPPSSPFIFLSQAFPGLSVISLLFYDFACIVLVEWGSNIAKIPHARCTLQIKNPARQPISRSGIVSHNRTSANLGARLNRKKFGITGRVSATVSRSNHVNTITWYHDTIRYTVRQVADKSMLTFMVYIKREPTSLKRK